MFDQKFATRTKYLKPSSIRQMMAIAKELLAQGKTVYFVERKLSSDNAAMIALAAYKKLEYAQATGKPLQTNIDINPNMKVRNW